MMKRVHSILLCACAGLAGCSGETHEREAVGAPAPAEFVGSYADGRHIGDLEIKPDGAYSCFVANGLTSGGCATFAGAGVSSGTWTVEAGEILFEPESEPGDLVVSFAGAHARISDEGLTLTAGGKEYAIGKYDNIPWEVEESEGSDQAGGAARGR